MAITRASQLRVMLSKQVIMKKRRWCCTGCEFGCGLVTSFLIAYLFNVLLFLPLNQPALIRTEVQTFPNYNESLNILMCLRSEAGCVIGFVPDSDVMQQQYGPLVVANFLELSGIPIPSAEETLEVGSDGPPKIPLTDTYFATEDEMDSFIDDNRASLLGGVIFNNSGSFTEYVLKVNNSYLPYAPEASSSAPSPFASQLSFFNNASIYLDSGFVSLQTAVDLTIITNAMMANASLPDVRDAASAQDMKVMLRSFGAAIMNSFTNITMQLLPLPEAPLIDLGPIFSTTYPQIAMLAFIPFVLGNSAMMIEEKTTRVKSLLMMMGMKDSMYWLSWIFALSIPAIFIVACLNVSTFVFSVFEHTDLTLVLALHSLFAINCMAFIYLLASLFQNDKFAMALGIVWLYIIGSLSFWLTTISFWAKVAAALLSPMAYSFAFVQIIPKEFHDQGLTWSEVNSTEYGNEMSVMWCMVMLAIDSALYVIIGWYISNVFPGDYGVPKPWYFAVLPRYWFSSRKAMKKDELKHLVQGNKRVEIDIDPSAFEEERRAPEDCTVSIDRLVKQYKGSSDNAVDGISIDLYGGEIFTLLGHNGAGKSTTISMLTGLYASTSGDATVLGYSINDDMDNVRQSIGVCPQHDALYPLMTGFEHLEMVAGLKGLPKEQVRSAIEDVLSTLALPHDRWHVYAKDYSGGMMRKLSLAMALLGDSKVLFLDEPSSGMDPVSRRHVWDVLLQAKRNRTIIITTHFMEEADVLGDRIAIMSAGKLKCCGSPSFLKRRYGIGFTLCCTKQYNENAAANRTPSKKRPVLTRDGSSDDDDNDMDNQYTVGPQLAALAGRHVPGSKLLTESANDVNIRIPQGSQSHFPSLFRELDTQIATLGLVDYGISMTTLEDVFLKLAEDFIHTNEGGESKPKGIVANQDHEQIGLNKKKNKNKKVNRNGQYEQLDDGAMVDDESLMVDMDDSDDDDEDAVFGKWTKRRRASTTQRFVVLMQKKFLSFYRDWTTIFIVIAVPLLMLILCFQINQAALNGAVPSYPTDTLLIDAADLNPTPDAVYWAAGDAVNLTTDLPLAQLLIDGLPLQEQGGVSFFNFTDDVSTDREDMLLAIQKNQNTTNANVSGSYVFNELGFTDFNGTALPFVDYTVLYNQTLLLSLPAYLNQMASSILRAVTGDDTTVITAFSKPFDADLNAQAVMASNSPASMSLNVLFVLNLVVCVFGKLANTEEYVGARWQIFLTGTSPALYWLTTLIADSLLFGLSMVVTGVLAFIYDFKPYIGSAIVPFIIMSVMYTISVLLMNYILSMLFRKPSGLIVALVCINFAMCLVPFFGGVVIQILIDTDKLKSDLLQKLVPYFGVLFPPSNYLSGLQALEGLSTTYQLMNEQPTMKVIFQWDTHVTLAIVAFAAQIVVLTILLALMQWARMRVKAGESAVGGSKMVENAEQMFIDDMDVAAERKRVEQKGPEDEFDTIQATQVFKTFGAKKDMVVHNLTFGVPRNQCFGLLGPNGAGKSTSIGMLAGEISPTYGEILLDGQTVDMGQSSLYSAADIGVCLQTEALWESLTGREHLEILLRLRRDVTKKEAYDAATKALGAMLLDAHADKPSGGYSGGTKRKLSVLVAMIASSNVLFLDEPSSGLDPASRRALWKVISASLNDRAIILTTHSMEEAEAVCDRIGIIVNGRFECYGTAQHLKNRFGGYRLDICQSSAATFASDAKVNPLISSQGAADAAAAAAGPDANPVYQKQAMSQEDIDADELHSIVLTIFPEAKVLDFYASRRTYELGRVTSLADAFQSMEDCKERFNITDYSITQPSLEQVFLQFARQQESEDE